MHFPWPTDVFNFTLACNRSILKKYKNIINEDVRGDWMIDEHKHINRDIVADNMEMDNIKSDHIDNQDNPFDDKNEINSGNAQIKQDVLSKRKGNIYRSLRILFAVVAFVFAGLLINEVWIQPYRSQKTINEITDLYQNVDDSKELIDTDVVDIDSTPETDLTHQNDELNSSDDSPPKDNQGRLLQFSSLLQENEDVKGWLTIPESNMDYPVLQSSEDDPEYYLHRNLYEITDKAGSIFLDIASSVEKNTKNYVLHGHNMTSTDNMFHYLLEYNELAYYRKRPVITFDTIYKKGQWKIIALFKTNGSSKNEPLFNYTRSIFADDNDYLNFLYQIMIRSVFDYQIDVNENDQILTLSTCSYELDDYRTVVVARRIREGEDLKVDTHRAVENLNPLYPNSWYHRYGGKAPEHSTFEEALENGEINWYVPVE